MALDAHALARRQLVRDRQRTKKYPWLLARKLERMSRSPLAYLRGAAPLFYEALSLSSELARGPAGDGWLIGDLHLENFGAYRVEDDSIVFDLNDFDETFVGPLRLDLLRLVTSLVLGGRTMGFDGKRALELGRDLVEAYDEVAFGGAALPRRPAPIELLLKKVGARTKRSLLDARTEVVRGSRRFRRGDRYVDLPATVVRSATRAFEAYIAARALEGDPNAFDVIDVAFRVAGTGSLGLTRFALLTRGKGSVDGAWIYDMKAEIHPAGSAPNGARGTESGARRVLSGMRACLSQLPKHSGLTQLGRESLLVRRFSPQEDKLDLRRIEPEHLDGLARHLGGLVGRAHARGAKTRCRRWTSRDVDGLLDRAATLAGLHEAAYLAMCRAL